MRFAGCPVCLSARFTVPSLNLPVRGLVLLTLDAQSRSFEGSVLNAAGAGSWTGEYSYPTDAIEAPASEEVWRSHLTNLRRVTDFALLLGMSVSAASPPTSARVGHVLRLPARAHTHRLLRSMWLACGRGSRVA